MRYIDKARTYRSLDLRALTTQVRFALFNNKPPVGGVSKAHNGHRVQMPRE